MIHEGQQIDKSPFLFDSEEDEYKYKKDNYFKRLYKTYDRAFLLNLILIYVNGGFKVFYTVCL